MNLLYVFEHGDTVLVTTFLLLIGMSLASWYVIFWKLWNLRQERRWLAAIFPEHAYEHLAAHTKTQGYVSFLLQRAEQVSGQITGYDPEQRKNMLEMQLSHTLDMIRASMDRGLTLLASVGTSAPFIGLFGTVWGVYNALTRIAAEGNASLNVVAGPMGEALVATAVGLFAAIPAVLAYNAFVRSNRLMVQDLRHIAEHLTFHMLAPSTGKNREAVKLVAGKK